MLFITSLISIEESELEERFVRSSGPGGQNVNKVSTAVQLRFDLARNESLHPAAKQRLRTIAGQKLTTSDQIVIHAENHRTQKANRDEARRRLAQMVREALVTPAKRRKTRPSKGVLVRRAQSKKNRSVVKSMRRRPPRADE